jgi:hypothetical protein
MNKKTVVFIFGRFYDFLSKKFFVPNAPSRSVWNGGFPKE